MASRASWKILAALVSTALLASCNPFGLRDLLEAAARAALAIEPSSATVPANATIKFRAEGGVPGYTYSIVSGGGSIDAETGTYTAPMTAGTAVIRVRDAAGATADAAITIETLTSGLLISPSSITLTVNSSVTFEAVGGTGSGYAFAITDAQSGAPEINATTGYYVAGSVPGTDTITVTDSGSATARAQVTVVALSSAVDYSVSSTAALPSAAVAGEAITGGLSFTVTNAGPGDGAATVEWKVYLSTNATLDGGDVVVDEGTTPALADDASAAVSLSGAWPAGPTGGGFLIVTVDAADDTSPGNNTAAPKAFTLEPRPVDYDVISVNHTSGAYTGEPVSGDFTVQNVGTATGVADIHWYVYASVDTSIDGSDYLLQSGNRAALGAGAGDTIPIATTWPTSPALYRLLVRVSATDDTVGANDTGWTSQVDVQGPPPADIDYASDAPLNTGATVAGGLLMGTFQLANVGTVAGTKTVYWSIYRSSDTTLDVGSDPVVDVGSRAPLGAGASTVVAYDGVWPAGAATWYLFAVVSAVDDADTGNNDSAYLAVPVTIPNVDYVPAGPVNTGATTAGEALAGTFLLTNTGTAAGSQAVFWTVYRSPDATLEIGTDPVADQGSRAPLGAGASAPVPYAGTWPAGAATWYLFAVVSADDDVDPGDNQSAGTPVAVTTPNADYDVLAVASTGGTTAGQALSGSFTVKNLGPHDGTQAVPWRAYLSSDAVYDAGVDLLFDSGVIDSPGLAYNATSSPIGFTGSWPTEAATWYLVVVVDAGDDQNPANDWAASGAVATTAPNVNYDVLAVTNTGGTAAGGPLAGEFTVKNIGTDDGSRTVYWTAYRSDDATLTVGTDPVIDTGSTAALPSGATSATIPFANAWPAATVVKTYYLFVRVSAADDVLAADDTGNSGIVTVNPPHIDYDVVTINNTGSLVAGGALGGTFQVQNVGSVNGSATLYWTVYRSLDLVFTQGVDPVVDSGSIVGGLTAGNSANPTFAGTWPEDTVSHTYYYYVQLVAADNIGAGNDWQFSSGYVVNPPAAFPDYRIVNPVYQATGTPGAALSGAHSFQIQNALANPGTKNITWRVYASRDAVLDGSDTLLDMNTIGPLGASATSGVIAYAGTWPAFGSYYRLIISLDADDDANPSNDGWMSGTIEVLELAYTEGAENNSSVGPTTVPLPNVSATGIVMDEGRYVLINGTMDAKLYIDTYKLQLGADATRLGIRLVWATGDDACDLYLWDESNAQGSEATVTTNLEEVTFINLTAGAVYYIGVYFCANHSGSPYQLYLYAEPD